MVKQLRYFARFIVVCLLLGRHTIVDELVSELTTLVEEYIMLKPNDAQEWQLVVQEITLFLQVCISIYRYTQVPNLILNVRPTIPCALRTRLIMCRTEDFHRNYWYVLAIDKYNLSNITIYSHRSLLHRGYICKMRC